MLSCGTHHAGSPERVSQRLCFDSNPRVLASGSIGLLGRYIKYSDYNIDPNNIKWLYVHYMYTNVSCELLILPPELTLKRTPVLLFQYGSESEIY